MQLGEVAGDRLQVRVVPRARADAVLGVSRLVAIRGVVLDAEVGSPGPASLTDRRCQSLTRRICSGQTAKIAGDARGTADKEAQRRSGRAGRCTVLVTSGDDQDHDQNQKRSHRLSLKFLRDILGISWRIDCAPAKRRTATTTSSRRNARNGSTTRTAKMSQA